MHNISGDGFDGSNFSSESMNQYSFEDQNHSIVAHDPQDLSQQQFDFNHEHTGWSQQHHADLNSFHTDLSHQYHSDLYQQQNPEFSQQYQAECYHHQQNPEFNQQYQADYHHHQQQTNFNQHQVDFHHNQMDWNQQVNAEKHIAQSRTGSEGWVKYHSDAAQKERDLQKWNQENANKAADNAKWYAENGFPDKAESYTNQANQWQASADSHNKAAQKELEQAADYLKKEAQNHKN